MKTKFTMPDMEPMWAYRSVSPGTSRAGMPGAPCFTHILVPIDLSEGSLGALRYVEALAKQFGARITLLHVIAPSPAFAVGEEEADAFRAAEDALESVARSHISGDLDVHVLVRNGFVFETVEAVARELGADLIVITTHGHDGMKRLFTGSTAECITRAAPCPVLVVRPCELAAEPL